MKKLLVIIGVVLLVAGFTVASFYFQQELQRKEQIKAIALFEECAKLFPVLESYPARCVTPDGRSFTQDIGNELEYRDEILVDNPRPNQVVSSPLGIKGKARGIWYFEGSFSAELFDENNKSLGTAILTAEGEWMTEEFVPFAGELEFVAPPTETGTLKIRNANASGLPENQKELMMPVRFKE